MNELKSSVEELRSSIENTKLWQTIDDKSATVLSGISTGSIDGSITENDKNLPSNEPVRDDPTSVVSNDEDETKPVVHNGFFNKFEDIFESDDS